MLLDIIDSEIDDDEEILTPVKRKKGKTPLKCRSPFVDDEAEEEEEEHEEQEEEEEGMNDYYEEEETGDNASNNDSSGVDDDVKQGASGSKTTN